MIQSTAQNNNFINPETGRISITKAFGEDLAILLAGKIIAVHKDFGARDFCRSVKKDLIGKSYTQRVEVIADNLKQYLPKNYPEALSILMRLLGPENKEEAKNRGIKTIFVESESEDVGAVAFYRAIGGEEVAVNHFNFNL